MELSIHKNLPTTTPLILQRLLRPCHPTHFTPTPPRIMGKTYFEFLEEEFQALATELQRALAEAIQQIHQTEDRSMALEQRFQRCEAIYGQLRREAGRDKDFRERLPLYKIQLDALREHYKEEIHRQEQTMVFAARGTQLEQD